MHSKTLSAAAALFASVALVAGAVSPAVAAAANDPAAPAKARQEQTEAKNDTRKYCIDTTATGSRIEKRECRTRADWLEVGVDPLKLMKQAR
ncbi:hypothetical protein J2W22_004652 [Sphingomonas kyeonggiensis]|uniref:hypothetical protein n=1 Tax=Sphingomonas kyeonggiensis TaxID=1268553 RepID=UPI0027883148|nr:hypothetical protein [Sphingomonas kyeonggiensis]MDQ0252564.1 hypothetical protein [Sphingomonas kyeonggiensis]